jgi:acyl carrier protein
LLGSDFRTINYKEEGNMQNVNYSKEIIFEDLKLIINDCFKIETNDIAMDTLLFSGGLSLNSIQMIELTVAIEKHYDFEFEDELLVEDSFRNFDVLTNVVKEILTK